MSSGGVARNVRVVAAADTTAFRALSDVVLAIASEHEVEPVLQRLVHSARELAGARHPPPRVPGGGGAVAGFLTPGGGHELIAAPGPPPPPHRGLRALVGPPPPP